MNRSGFILTYIELVVLLLHWLNASHCLLLFSEFMGEIRPFLPILKILHHYQMISLLQTHFGCIVSVQDAMDVKLLSKHFLILDFKFLVIPSLFQIQEVAFNEGAVRGSATLVLNLILFYYLGRFLDLVTLFLHSFDLIILFKLSFGIEDMPVVRVRVSLLHAPNVFGYNHHVFKVLVLHFDILQGWCRDCSVWPMELPVLSSLSISRRFYSLWLRILESGMKQFMGHNVLSMTERGLTPLLKLLLLALHRGKRFYRW